MTSRESIASTADSIAGLIGSCGVTDKAEWMHERVRTLRDPNASLEQCHAATRELRRVIPGMNGLTDLYLTPPAGSPYDETQINKVLQDLTEQLYEETR